MKNTCKNCEQEVSGNFCSKCGQSADTEEIDSLFLIHEFQHTILHVDKGIIYTSKELFLRPGKVIHEFINGKRVKYFRPFAFVFIISTFYSLLAYYLHVESMIDNIRGGFSHKKTLKVDDIGSAMQYGFIWMRDHYAYASVILLPLISLFTYIFFIESKQNYMRHLILNAYVTGQRILIYIVFIPILYFSSKVESIVLIFKLTEIIAGFALTIWMYHKFFDENSLSKNVILTIATYLAVILFSVVINLDFLFK